MFDLSLAEILLVVIVAVIFIGPDELPVVIRHVSKAARSLRSLAGELRAAFDDVSQDAGLREVSDDLSHAFRQETRLIRGDDGQMYESYPPVRAGTPLRPPVTDAPDAH